MPTPNGISVIVVRLSSMLKAEISVICPCSKNVRSARSIRNGIVNTVMTLVTADSVTQSGTSARDANV